MTTSNTVSAPKNLRTGFQFRYDTAPEFTNLKAEIELAIKEGIVSKNHSMVKWILSPCTQAKIDALQSGDNLIEEELTGFGKWSTETANAVREVLNKNVLAKATNRQIVAAYVASVSIPNYSTLDIDAQEKAKSSMLAWVDANSINETELKTNPTSNAILISKRGPSGGVKLRTKLVIEVAETSEEISDSE